MSVDGTVVIDARNDLDITEASLNELVTNISTSSLALNMWTDLVKVNTTVYRNTYHFARPLNLVLPYTHYLDFGLVIVIFGLVSMGQNGVPVADGGFVQTIMATRGKTEMESLVLRQGLVDPNAMTKELKGLKIRYGDLVDTYGASGDKGKIYGFGTVEETISLRRGGKAFVWALV